MCHFHLESSNPCGATVSQLMLPWWWQKHHANILAAAIFRPEGLSSGGCRLLTDTARNFLHASWPLSVFPQSRGSAMAFLTSVPFSSAVTLGRAPRVLPAVEAPARHRFYPSPKSSAGIRAGPPGHPTAGRLRYPQLPAHVRLVCLSVLCSNLGPSPEIMLYQHVKSFCRGGQEGAISAVCELVFILTKCRHVVDHVSPGPVTPEHLGILAAPHLAPFNFAAIWAVWRWCEEDF